MRRTDYSKMKIKSPSATRTKGLLRIVALTLALFVSLGLFAACNDDVHFSYTDVYKEYPQVNEYRGYDTLFTLPVGTVVSTETNAHGYQSSLGGFILSKKDESTSYYGFLKLSDSITGRTLSDSDLTIEPKFIKLSYGFGRIAVMASDGDVSIYDTDGNVLMSDFINATTSTAVSLDTILKFLSSDYVTVLPRYAYANVSGMPTDSNRYPIYKLSLGRMYTSVRNIGDSLDNIEVFDEYCVLHGRVNNSTNFPEIHVMKLTETAVGFSSTATAAGVFTAHDSQTTNYQEVTYFGNGKFLVYERCVGQETEYFYKEDVTVDNKADVDYWQVYRYLYYPETDKVERYDSDVVYVQISNSYYRNSSRSDINADTFLNDGYSYVEYGYRRNADGYASYDQFIIKNDTLEIVLSLSQNLGYNVNKVSDTQVTSLYALIMTYVDGYGFVESGSGVASLMDRNGNKLFSKSDMNYLTAQYNSGMLVCSALKPGTESEVVYGAYDLNGNLCVPFEFNTLTAYRGYYCFGQRTDMVAGAPVKRYYFVDKAGNAREAEDLATDIATTTSGTAIYKNGCYVYKDSSSGTAQYGIKNFNPNTALNVVVPATYSSMTLYYNSSERGDMYVFAKGVDNAYTVMRLK